MDIFPWGKGEGGGNSSYFVFASLIIRIRPLKEKKSSLESSLGCTLKNRNLLLFLRVDPFL